MGVCYTITDVSSSIVSHCREYDSNFHPEGCNYSVPAIIHHPTALQTTFSAIPGSSSKTSGDTLWIGASKIDGTDYRYPGINTLVDFFVIYALDISRWISNDATMDHTTELIALEINLGLCMYTYNTSMTFGITTTDQIGEPTTLNWQFGQEIIGTTSVQTITATQDSDVFWMDTPNVQAFNNYLSLHIFTGNAQMLTEDLDADAEVFTTDSAHAIASSLYGNPSGTQGLSNLLGNLTTSMSNA